VIRICLLAAGLLATNAAAQTPGPDAGRIFGPGDPAQTRPVEYRSVFGADRAGEAAPADWRQANDEMARLRGHMGHLRDEGQSTPAPADATAAPLAPSSHDHKH
jgi:hypothetical protein